MQNRKFRGAFDNLVITSYRTFPPVGLSIKPIGGILNFVKLKRGFFIRWFNNYGRHFPWRDKGTTPFAFLVTEMLLRQTRAASVAKLWHEFFRHYPNAPALADADPAEVIDQIAILGFGKMRGEALVSMARWLVEFHDGQVPSTRDELVAIPHVGSYAAHAVLCFGFGKRVEIVDTNVQRFFARYNGLKVKADIRRNPHVTEIARQALPRDRARAQQHNYGLLDFTADVCKPGRPRCEICPLATSCEWGKVQTKALKRKI